MLIYTIGHSIRPFDELVGALRSSRMRTLVDPGQCRCSVMSRSLTPRTRAGPAEPLKTDLSKSSAERQEQIAGVKPLTGLLGLQIDSTAAA